MKKFFKVLICGILFLSLSTGCQNSYNKSDARNDLINYLEEKYNEEFEVTIIQEFHCSGGIGICEYRGEAYSKNNPDLKFEVDLSHEDFSDNYNEVLENNN